MGTKSHSLCVKSFDNRYSNYFVWQTNGRNSLCSRRKCTFSKLVVDSIAVVRLELCHSWFTIEVFFGCRKCYLLSCHRNLCYQAEERREIVWRHLDVEIEISDYNLVTQCVDILLPAVFAAELYRYYRFIPFTVISSIKINLKHFWCGRDLEH